MGMMEQILFSWSGGKDSAMALKCLLGEDRYNIVSLITTVTEDYSRVSMHGFRRSLLEAQALSLGIPLYEIIIPAHCTDTDYAQKMLEAMNHWKQRGVTAVAFGDIHLADIRTYREEKLSSAGMSALFPLWGISTKDIVHTFLDEKYRGIITCVDTTQLDCAFAGREMDASFLRDLPAGVDPCGEKGEYHSFVFDGPIFSSPVKFKKGGTVLRDDRFCFCDLIPV
jgi:uncharacterized protein (TIGR00290 family)